MSEMPKQEVNASILGSGHIETSSITAKKSPNGYDEMDIHMLCRIRDYTVFASLSVILMFH